MHNRVPNLSWLVREIAAGKRSEVVGSLDLELIQLGLAPKPQRPVTKRRAHKAARKAVRLELSGEAVFDPCTQHCEPGYCCFERWQYAVDRGRRCCADCS